MSPLSRAARSPISARLVRVSWNLNTDPDVTSSSTRYVTGFLPCRYVAGPEMIVL
jgi:hypothetical protein